MMASNRWKNKTNASELIEEKIGIPYEAIDDHFFCSTEDLDNENKWTDCVACYDSNLRIKAIQTLNKQH